MAFASDPTAYASVNVSNFILSALYSNDFTNTNNYVLWRKQMLCLIESQGLLAFIDGSAPPTPENDDQQDYDAWKRTDRLIMDWILGALSDAVAGTVTNFSSARDVWLQLEFNFITFAPAAPFLGENEWHKYLPLYKAALNCEWEKTRQILEKDPDAINARVNHHLQTALHVAVGGGKSASFVEELVRLMSDDSVAKEDSRGFTALHVAAWTGNLPAAEILVSRLPDLLYLKNNIGHLPVHLAADAGHLETLEFLMSHTKFNSYFDPLDYYSGLELLNFIIEADYFDMAVGLVDKHPQLARMRPRPSFSALMQITARAKAFSIEAQLNLFQRIIYNCIQLEGMGSPVVVENQTCCGQLLQEVPRWCRGVVATLRFTVSKVIKLLTILPHVKRIYEKKVMHRDALRLVKCLCKHMESLTYNEAAEIFREVMISAATLGIAEVIETVVDTFPPAIYFVDDSTMQNFLHIAVKNRCQSVFNLMYRTNKHRYLYSDDLDTSGNSILHLAATLAPPHKLNLVSGAALQVQREIQWFQEADKFIGPYNRGRSNKDGKTPEMVFTEEHRELKVEGEKWMKDTANSCSIAAALIVTVVFAAAITVPGGNDQSSGYPVFLDTQPAFIIFAVSDSISLFTSTTSLLMFLSILTSRYAEQDFLYALPKRLCIGLVSLFVSILFMMMAFCSTVYLVFGKNIKGWILMPVAAFACLPITAFVLLQFPLLLAVISSTYGRGGFGKQSDRPFP